MPDAPIFILGTERSGSNLLRLILNSHSRIVIPHPPHIVRYFTPLEPGYGDLAVEANFAVLLDDVLQLLDAHIYRWEFAPDRERVLREARPRNAFGIYVALMDQARDAAKKARWGCKSTFMVDHVPAILERFPDAKLLFLVRDPRDVACSSRKSIFSTFHPYFTAELWRDQQTTGLRWLDELPRQTMRLVKYEELVASPEGYVSGICSFLGEPFEPQMLKFFETKEARRSASLSESWGNTADPVSARSVGRYRGELSERELLVLEHVAEGPMLRLGYRPLHRESELRTVRIGATERSRFATSERLAWLRAELRSLRNDKNVWRRWRRGLLLWRLRRARAR
jgi:hypothetical protein